MSRHYWTRLGRWAAIVGVPVELSGCGISFLSPRGPVADAERLILLDSLAIMLAIVVPTILATFAFAWWFRAGNTRAQRLPKWSYSGRLELLVWSIPTLVIVVLGGLIWTGSHRLDPFAPLPSAAKPLEVQVVSLDWKWLFIYPDQAVASVNRLVVPAGVPVHFSLTSASVMNSFFVPQLAGMIATMNGMVTQISFQANRPGTYFGESTQFSGDGFSDMDFEVTAVPPGDFADWVRTTRGQGPVLDEAGYRALARQSIDVQPFTYRAVTPNLFHDIVRRKLPPGPGPRAGQPSPNVYPNHEPSHAG